MHIRTAVVAALVAARPAVSFAQATPSVSPAPASTEAAQPVAPAAPPASVAAAAPAEQPPKWTIGAGLVFVGGSVSLAAPSTRIGLLTIGSGFGPSIPVATFFVERRTSERTWLVFGAEGSVSRQSFGTLPASSTSFPDQTKDDAERVSLSVGLRRVVTRPRAPVEVSLQATVDGGYIHELQEFVTPTSGATSSIRDIGWFAGATGGIAVERELTGGLALRISTPLVRAVWTTVERKDDAGKRDGTSWTVLGTLAPTLELRLAF
jgi:hypothetical protein